MAVQKSTRIGPGAPIGRFCCPRVDFVALVVTNVGKFWAGGSHGPPRARGLVKKNDRVAGGGGSAMP